MGNFQEVLGINEVSSSKVINTVWKALLAEFLGNFLLNFFGCGSVVVMQQSPLHKPNFLYVALTFGIVVFVCVQVSKFKCIPPIIGVTNAKDCNYHCNQ